MPSRFRFSLSLFLSHPRLSLCLSASYLQCPAGLFSKPFSSGFSRAWIIRCALDQPLPLLARCVIALHGCVAAAVSSNRTASINTFLISFFRVKHTRTNTRVFHPRKEAEIWLRSSLLWFSSLLNEWMFAWQTEQTYPQSGVRVCSCQVQIRLFAWDLKGL